MSGTIINFGPPITSPILVADEERNYQIFNISTHFISFGTSMAPELNGLMTIVAAKAPIVRRLSKLLIRLPANADLAVLIVNGFQARGLGVSVIRFNETEAVEIVELAGPKYNQALRLLHNCLLDPGKNKEFWREVEDYLRDELGII